MRWIASLALLPLVSSAALSAPAPVESWGKAGITLTQYRHDALECGLKGHYSDISQTNDAKQLVRASRQLDNLQGIFTGTASGAPGVGATGPDVADQMGQFAATQQHIVDSVRPDERYKNIKKALEATTADCLQQRGYSKFTLTGTQQRHLRTLKPGSDQRRLFLYGLASDAFVLQAQRVAAQP